jgi:cell division control protein 6
LEREEKNPKTRNNTKTPHETKNKTKKTTKLLFNKIKTRQKHYKTTKNGLIGLKTKNTAPPTGCSTGNKGVGGSGKTSKVFIPLLPMQILWVGMKQKTLEDLFDSFLSKQSLFISKQALQDAYTPENVPHRNEQINQLAAILAPGLRGDRPSNVFIYGKTGTGKTLVSKFVCQELESKATKQKTTLKTLYMNCKMEKINTPYRLLARFLSFIDVDVPATGLPTDEVYKIFLREINKAGGVFIIVLDEIDTLVETDVLYNLTRINTELSNAQVSIIGISNDLNFTNNLDPRIKSSLSEEELVFPPYNAIQIQDILANRADIALSPTSLEEGTIAKCSALAAQEHGDVRRALDLLRVACEIAERNVDIKVNEGHVDRAMRKIDIDRVVEIVKTQPRQSQIVLYSIIYLKELNKNEVATGEVFEVYHNLCKQIGLVPLTQRRVSDLISELDMLGVINSLVVSKGRYGRTRKIKLDMTPVALEKTSEILRGELL